MFFIFNISFLLMKGFVTWKQFLTCYLEYVKQLWHPDKYKPCETQEHQTKPSAQFSQISACNTVLVVYVYVQYTAHCKHWYANSLCCCYSCRASKNSLVSSLGPGCNLGSRRGPAPIGLCPPWVPVMTPSLWGAFDLVCLCASAGPISGAWGG